jgi:ankyrin repeat protein
MEPTLPTAAAGACAAAAALGALAIAVREIWRARRPRLPAVHQCAAKGDADGVRRLLDADPTLAAARDASERTPLHMAVLERRLDVVQLLLEHGADAGAREGLLGFTPLHLVATRNHRALARTMRGRRVRRGHGDESARKDAEPEIASALLKAGAHARATAGFGRTPLHMAAASGQAETVGVLLDAGARIGAADFLGFTSLHYAAAEGNAEAAALLLERGADVDAAAQQGYRPLHTAAEKGHVAVCELLLRAGASAQAKTLHGRTALDLAESRRHRKVLDLLRTHGPDSAP